MRRTFRWAPGLWAALLGIAAYSQPVIAPTPQPAGSPRGDDAGAYNITNSWEIGFRFRSVDGNIGKYRSDVNFGNGLRLLGGSLGVHSRDGKGHWFDELLLDLRGLGNDPYQFSSLRLQKNSVYKYDLLWRSNEYFNPALPIAGGQHFASTNRQMQDHDVVLRPQGKVRLRVGYSHNKQDGGGLWTGQWFDTRGDEYTYLADIRRLQQEYRLGGDIEWRRLQVSVTRGWEFYKEDTRFGTPLSRDGSNPNDRNTLAFLRRDEPVRGRTPYWNGRLRAEGRGGLVVQGRFTHSSGARDFVFDESAQGTDRLGSDRNRQILLTGRGLRPVTTGYLTLTVHPNLQWTFTNQFGYHSTRMEGDARYAELNNATAGLSLVSFNFLGIRNLTNTSQASWQPRKWIGVFGEHHLSRRRIRSREFLETSLAPLGPAAEQFNRMQAGTAGVRLQPIKPLRILLSAELGRNDRPFYPTSDKDYHAIRARGEYRKTKYSLSTDYRSFNNTNSTSLFVHSSRGRTWNANGGWSPRANLHFDGGYSYLHQNTLTALAYFANFQLVTQDRSFYVSNLHTFYSSFQVQIRKRVDLYGGVVQNRDRGDGRVRGAGPSSPGFVLTPETADLFAGAQLFRFSYLSPSARISVVLRSNLRWNAGWQYYRYAETDLRLQDYRAHTGYVSLSYSF